MLTLPNVTLVCIDCINYLRALNAINQSIEKVNFAEVKILTSIDVFTTGSIQIVPIEPITNKVAYSYFVIKELHKYIQTDYALLVQWDGYVWSATGWSNEFLEYDYIGAVWHFRPDIRVGNGGFSLRSKKLLDLTPSIQEIITSEGKGSLHPEDCAICIFHRDYLMSHGIKFAPEDVADRFAVENRTYKGQFGWHGGTHPPGV